MASTLEPPGSDGVKMSGLKMFPLFRDSRNIRVVSCTTESPLKEVAL